MYSYVLDIVILKSPWPEEINIQLYFHMEENIIQVQMIVEWDCKVVTSLW